MALNVIDDAQLSDLRASGKPVVVDFYADWCAPCRAVAPELEKLAEGSSTSFVKLDIDANPSVAMELGIRSVPTIVHFSADGSEVARVVGAAPAAAIAQRLQLDA